VQGFIPRDVVLVAYYISIGDVLVGLSCSVGGSRQEVPLNMAGDEECEDREQSQGT
jgi:hypothetical protein